jgi:monoterpene epsilon-lactone hydrolase
MYSPDAYTRFAEKLSRQLDARVVIPDFRLAPENPFPAGLDDCLASYRFLIDEPRDPRSIVLAGESGGANAVLVTLQRARDLGLPMPAAAVLLSGAFDLTWSSPSIRYNADLDVAGSPRALGVVDRLYVGDRDRTDPMLSPIFGRFNGLPPLLFQVGSTEMLLDESIRAAERARMSEVDARIEVYERAPHAWHQLGGWLPEAQRAIDAIERFLQETAGW